MKQISLKPMLDTTQPVGVSRFIVTDNGSVDGTREILEQLSKEFNLSVIDEPSMTMAAVWKIMIALVR